MNVSYMSMSKQPDVAPLTLLPGAVLPSDIVRWVPESTAEGSKRKAERFVKGWFL